MVFEMEGDLGGQELAVGFGAGPATPESYQEAGQNEKRSEYFRHFFPLFSTHDNFFGHGAG